MPSSKKHLKNCVYVNGFIFFTDQQEKRSKNQVLLVHSPDHSVDLVLPVSCITTFYKVGGLLVHASSGRGQLEWPEEVVGGLEVLSDSVNLMDEILNADDSILTERLLNKGVICKSNALFVDLAISTLVGKLAYRFKIGVAPCNVGLCNTKHVDGSLVQFDKDTIEDLAETKKLKHLADFGADTVDTSDPNDKSQFGFSWDVEVACPASHSAHVLFAVKGEPCCL